MKEGNTSIFKKTLLEKTFHLIRLNKKIYQSDLWKQLGLGSRDGSRVVVSLLRSKVIKRNKVLYKGRWTYELSAIQDMRIVPDLTEIQKIHRSKIMKKSKRMTVVINDDLYRKLKIFQAIEIKKSGPSVSFSQIINQLVKNGLK